MLNLHIRYAMPEDEPQLTQLINQSVRGLNAHDYSPEQIEGALQYIYGIDSQLIEDCTYFVAQVDGQIAGCGGWSKRKTLFGGNQMKKSQEGDNTSHNLETDALHAVPRHDPAKIRAFFIHPDWSRQGIGRQLMKLCELEARRAGFTRLELMATLTGLKLYSKCGFQIVEHTRVIMPNGVQFPVIRMAKTMI